jgi:predicted ATPase
LAIQIKRKKKRYVIETHSEYLINRIRLLIVKGELDPTDISLYYFENTSVGSKYSKIDLTKDGKILNAPKSFFETYLMDSMEIALNA